MQKLFRIFIVISLVATSCTTKHTQEKQCSDTERLVMAVAWFQHSAEMEVQYRQAFEFAQLKLQKNLTQHTPDKKQAAVVLDIDETVLNNSPFEGKAIETGVAYTGESWKQWVDQGTAKALPGAVAFTKWAKEKGIEVFYISNRTVNTLDITVENLQKQGFPNAEKEFILLKEKTSDKTARRNKVKETHDILLYVGDNLTDFSETFRNRENNFGKTAVTEKWDSLQHYFIQLPNPMYGDWMNHLQGARDLTPCQRDSVIKSHLISF